MKHNSGKMLFVYTLYVFIWIERGTLQQPYSLISSKIKY